MELQTEQEFSALRGTVVCRMPSNDLYTFEGTLRTEEPAPAAADYITVASISSRSVRIIARWRLWLRTCTSISYGCGAGQVRFEGDAQTISLDASSLLLRGSSLRNIEWAVGAIVYAGMDTRVMMNSTAVPSKR